MAPFSAVSCGPLLLSYSLFRLGSLSKSKQVRLSYLHAKTNSVTLCREHLVISPRILPRVRLLLSGIRVNGGLINVRGVGSNVYGWMTRVVFVRSILDVSSCGLLARRCSTDRRLHRSLCSCGAVGGRLVMDVMLGNYSL